MSARSSPTTSTTESQQRSSSAVRRAAVITHGKPQTIGPALERLNKVASEAGVELLLPDEEVAKHGVGEPEDDLTNADIAVVLGGDGTMLRALQRFLGTEIPVVGVNFGRVGFLASIPPNELESGLARVFSGDYRVVHSCAPAGSPSGFGEVIVRLLREQLAQTRFVPASGGPVNRVGSAFRRTL